MRRRPLILLLLAALVLAGGGVAQADPPVTTPAVAALPETPDAQLGPVVAVDPVSGTRAVALDTDARAGVQQPQTGDGTATISATNGTTAWTDRGIMPVSSDTGSPSGGSPDVVWGQGSNVYAVELGRDPARPTDPCATGGGLFLGVSTNAGVNWSTVTLVNNGPNQVISDPSIAYSPLSGRIYVAYTKTDPCTEGAGSTSVVRLISTTPTANGNGNIEAVSPVSSNPQFQYPSIAVLPNGGVAIAYYSAATSPGQVEVTTCSPSVASDVTSEPTCGLSPVVVDGSALEPISQGSFPVEVRPQIATGPSGRAVVVWAEQTPLNGWDVFSSTSRDSGATFGAAVRIPADAGAADQIDPAIAIAQNGRADVAFYDSRFGPGYEVAVSASNLPTGAKNVETWSPSVPVESTPITPVLPFIPGPYSLGGRPGLDEIPRLAGPPWTLVSWTDTRNATGPRPQNEDIFSTVLLHGSAAPVGTSASFNVPKNLTSTVDFSADETDPDADAETYSIAQQGTLGQATIPDPNVPQLSYSAPNSVTTDHVQVLVSDGVNQTTITLTLNIVNTPPRITCTALSTPRDTPLPLTTAGCVVDDNGDPVTLGANSPVHGTLSTVGGVLEFVPDQGFEGTAQVRLVASDGIDTTSLTVNIVVTHPASVTVTVAGANRRAARIDQPLMLRASVPTGADPSTIVWRFGDGTTDQGPSVTHLFAKVKTYGVTAQVGDGPVATVTVFAQKPPLTVRSASIAASGALTMHIRLAAPGTVVVTVMHVTGVKRVKVKLKRGSHSMSLRLPAAVLGRGTILVKLSLGLGNGGTDTIRRAVLVPRV